MSYNIRHCSPYLGSGVPSPAEVGNVAKVLKDKNADVVLLQEVDSMTTRALNIDQSKHPTLAAFVWASSFTTFARKTLCLYSTKQMFFGFVALQ